MAKLQGADTAAIGRGRGADLTSIVEVVFTGGTIGSQAEGHSTGLGNTPPVRLLEGFLPDMVEFRTSEPFRILSEDATTEHWSSLAAHVARLDFSRVDAVVVTHGSDTLAWTAKALAFALAGVPRPVVLVGSDRPISDPLSNGPDNFRDAIAFALGEKLPGVFVAWKNPAEPTSIHLASRIQPCDPYDDHFRSARGLRFGVVENGTFHRDRAEANPSRGRLVELASSSLWKHSREIALTGVRFDPNVLVLSAQPGGNLAFIEPSSWSAILRIAYHSGTAPSFPGVGTLVDLANRCMLAGTPLVVGPCRHGCLPYESVERLRDCGAVFSPAMEASTLVVKLQWLLGTNQDLARLEEDLVLDSLPETIFRS